MKKFILLLLLVLLIPLKVQAACGCAPGSQCRYTRPDTTPYSYVYKNTDPATKVQTSTTIYCDTPWEADSVFATRSAICGASPEIAPHCAIKVDENTGKRDPSQLTCYGAEFSYAEQADPNGISKKIPENKLSPVGGSINFAGKTYTGVGQVLWCNSIAFCCARSDIGCEAPATTFPPFVEPTSPLDAWAQPTLKPLSVCTAPSGAGESRIFIPHLRNISALATLLQTMFNPFPSLFEKNAAPVPVGTQSSSSLTNTDDVTSKIYFHQGLNDNTQYVDSSNNSSLKVGTTAPAPLYSFTGGSVYKQDGLCSIADTRYNPGDDLLGPTITTSLEYTQKYTYQALPKRPGCTADNDTTSDPSSCCSAVAGVAATDISVDPTQKLYRCGTAPGYREKTKGQIAVFTKTPLVEYIYNVLVTGPQSVFNRLMPKDNPTEIKEIPGQAFYNASSDGDSMAVGGRSGTTPTLYFPHIGSLKEYFLDGIQKALRPLNKGTSVSSTPNDALTNGTNSCSPLTYTIDYRNTNILPKPKADIIKAISTRFPGNQVNQHYDLLVQNSIVAGYNPAFVMAVWIEETGASDYQQFTNNIFDLGCGAAPKGDFKKQLSCFLGLYDDWSLGGKYNNLVGSCRLGGTHPNFEDFMLFFAEGVCQTVDKQDRQFCGTHTSFPDKINYFYNLVVRQ